MIILKHYGKNNSKQTSNCNDWRWPWQKTETTAGKNDPDQADFSQLLQGTKWHIEKRSKIDWISNNTMAHCGNDPMMTCCIEWSGRATAAFLDLWDINTLSIFYINKITVCYTTGKVLLFAIFASCFHKWKTSINIMPLRWYDNKVWSILRLKHV